jgi:diguanylate cyclase (GGDEF)-like protein/PAS domain S-box-containing protein
MELMHHSYHFEIVILSIFIAIFGAYTSIDLTKRISPSMKKRFLWITGSSFVMWISTWSMHFTGMEAMMGIALILFGTTLFVSYVKREKAEQKAYLKEAKYRSLFEQNQDGIIILNKHGKIVDVNQATEVMTGFTMGELNGGGFDNYIHPDDLLATRSYFQESLAGVHHEFQVRVFPKDKREMLLKVKNVPLQIDGKIDGIYAIIRDITEQIRVEKQLREQDEKYELITENMQDLVSILYPSGEFDFVSPSHKNVLGYKISDLIGSQAFDLAHPDDFEELMNDFTKILETKETVMAVYRLQHRNGHYVALESKGSPILDQENNIKRVLISSRDVSERMEQEQALAQYEEQLKQLAFYDSLTCIPNRRLFQDRLLQTIQKAKRDHTNLALFYLDCDRFKWVNDTYGHETGDRLLKGFVERVKDCIRESDTVARLGGDEFAIIVDGFESVQDVARIANRIIQKVRNPWNLNGAEFIISTSIGIAIYPEDGTDMDTLLVHADKALYESKESGRDTYHFYTNEIAAKIDRTMLLEDGLKLAISHGHFHLVYQPQMDIQNNTLAGLEVLLRYTHPKIGLVSPVEFIPMCEKLGLIDEVTEWVMSVAFKQQKEWKESGYGEIPIAINISPTTLENNSFLQTVQYYLDQFDTNPESIEFELTEDAFMHNMKFVGEILGNLNRMGIKISLDDFGAGYSSLKYLKDLPIDKVKIDRSFIMGIPEKEKEKAIIESILDLTRRLQGEVICEGVETEDQISFLLVKGCRLVQGFYFSKPLAKEELETTFLKQQILSFRTKTNVVNPINVSSF